MRVPPFATLLLLVACADLPEIGSGAPGPYPELVPLGPVIAAAEAPGRADPAPELGARVAALEARAARLRRPAIGAAERARLDAAVADR